MLDLNTLKISLNEAIKIANDGETILLENKTYNEKIVLTKKNITLIGQNNTVISYNAHSGMIIPKELGGDGEAKFTTTTSATFRVIEEADGFKAFGITFMNTYKRDVADGGQAVAFKSEINDLLIENCRFIGEQDTLYIDKGRNNQVTNSYIEGDIDFIFGSADCTFNNCNIVGLNKELVYFTAPSTFAEYRKGFHFKYCNFESKASISHIGRPWYPTNAKKAIFPRLIIKKCNFKGNISLDFVKMNQKDPDKYELRIKDSKLNNVFVDKDIFKK